MLLLGFYSLSYKMLKFPLCCSELSFDPKILVFAAPPISISHTKRQIVPGRGDSIKVSAAKIGNFSLGSVGFHNSIICNSIYLQI